MLSHFAVGAARSLFTGRGAFRSGLDMFLVGLGVAVVGYFVGMLIEHL
jgi:VIT1/CCC1 family predicted Fe2+/Mn2+ transporter